MALTSQERTNLIKLTVGMFNAAPGATYLAEITVIYEANGRSLANVASILAGTPAYKTLNPVFQTAAEFAAAFLTPLGLQANTTAVDFVIASFNSTNGDKGATALATLTALAATTAPEFASAQAILNNKTSVAENYSVTLAAAVTNLAQLQQVLSTVTADVASVAAANAASSNTTGSTLTLTKGVDILTGTSANDTFIADNTAAAAADKQLSVADQLNGGAGTDTLKIYLAAGDTSTGQPTLTNIEEVYINGGAVTAYTAATGTTKLSIDAPVVNTVATYTVNGQAVSLANHTVTANTTTTIAQAAAATATAQTITLNGVTASTGNVHTIDASGAKVATLNLVTATAASTITLANTGAGIKTVNISGDKALTLTENAATAAAITKIDASTATGNVTVDTSAAAKAATFTFTGGAGADKVTFAAGDFALLTAGSQLDGGAGTDTLVIKDTTPAYTAINAAKNFEVLGLGVNTTVVDAAQLTSIKSFAIGVAASTETINNLGAGSAVAVTVATTAVNLGAALGNTATDITLGSSTAVGVVTTALTTTGLTSVSLTSNGTSANTITTLANSDNTTLTIKGAADLTITNALGGTTTGSKVDASAFTGKLTVIGSGVADIIIGGTGADTLSGGANAIADTLTGGAGNDKFSITAGATAATADVITDFVTKADTIAFGGAAGSAANYKEALTSVADFASALAAANVAFAAAAVLYNVQQVGTDSYVFYTAVAADGVADAVVKLTGVALTGVEQIDIVA